MGKFLLTLVFVLPDGESMLVYSQQEKLPGGSESTASVQHRECAI